MKGRPTADGARKGTVGFALTALQRRLASSPEAIYQSLKRRRIKLKRRVEEEKLRSRGQSLAETIGFNGTCPMTSGSRPTRCRPTTTRTSKRRSSTRRRPRRPSRSSKPKSSSSNRWRSRPGKVFTRAKTASGTSCRKLLQNTPEMHDAEGAQRKLIIFTEHRDTLNYLHGEDRAA
jgi:hypothetical protein